ncbi:hypothetical protein GY45DRAFT_1327634 [Cubamyces sp. BRFM 1775]|nr:hypothetical protein GY45DRAFT_1327634 [Cubamyces sp. BRFM 1775]
MSEPQPPSSSIPSCIDALCHETSSYQRHIRALPEPPTPAPPYTVPPESRPTSEPDPPTVEYQPADSSIPIVPALSWYMVDGAESAYSSAISFPSGEEGNAEGRRPTRWIVTAVSCAYLLEDLHPDAEAIQATLQQRQTDYNPNSPLESRRTYVSSTGAGGSEVSVPDEEPPEYRGA